VTTLIIKLESTGSATRASLAAMTPDGLPRTVTGVGRNASMAITEVTKMARKEGLLGWAWSCPEVGLRGVL
jgi:hypothetical protein